MSIEDKLKELNIIIPKAPLPVGAYVAFKIINKLVYISGQLPINNQGEILKGKIGKQLNLEDGKKAAHFCCINIIAQLNLACNNNLNNVKNCVKITGYVNSTEDFVDQPKIINAASELISNIFEEKGKHTRVAVSANSLPLGASVEIDAIFEIK